MSTTNVTSRATSNTVSVPLEFWTYPKPEKHTIKVTKDQLNKELQNIDPDQAATISNAVFSGIGGGAGVIGLILSITLTTSWTAGPVGALIAAIVGLGAGLAAGVMAIVQRVRAENGTNLAIYNAVPGSGLIVNGVSDFDGKLIDDDADKPLDPSVVKGAFAYCTDEQIGGIGMHLMPHGGKSRMEGALDLSFNIGGNKNFRLLLSLKNKVGAGQRSTYQIMVLPTPSVFTETGLPMIAPISVTSNRKNNVVEDSFQVGNLFRVELKLEHATNEKGNKDQRKDLVSVFITPSTDYLKSQ